MGRIKSFLKLMLLLGAGTFVFLGTAVAQVEKGDIYYGTENYRLALAYYSNDLKRDSMDTYLNFQIAQCILKMNTEKSAAIPYLSRLIENGAKKYMPLIFFQLGVAHFHKHDFEEAIRNFEYYKKYVPEAQHFEVNRYEDFCLNAEALINAPANVNFINLGKGINSKSDDFNPFVSADETRMFFSSRKDLRSVKVYMSEKQNYELEWGASQQTGTGINIGNDQIVSGITADGTDFFFYYNNYRLENNDLVISENTGTNVWETTVLKPNINSPLSEEGASLSASKDTLFFASARPGGLGGLDIYMSKRLPNGDWGEPVNMGPTINTVYDDNFPNLSEDGKTLYFSSLGHNSMGGYDLFKTIWSENELTWSEPQNLGYPINNTYDNTTICFVNNDRYAYISSFRDGGFGELDIYKLVFEDKDADIFIYTGVLELENPDHTGKPLSVAGKNVEFSISVFNKATGNYFGVYSCKPNNGKFVVALPPGSYELEVISPLDLYQDLVQPLVVNENTYVGMNFKYNIMLKLRNP